MTETFRHREILAELITDSEGQDIFLSQQDGSGCNEPSVVILAPWQLRALGEQFGLVEASDPQAAKTIATLQRRMLVLEKRIAHLADYLCTCSDSEHANLDYEVDYAASTAEIAAEFIADLQDAAVVPERTKHVPEASKPDPGTPPLQMSIDA